MKQYILIESAHSNSTEIVFYDNGDEVQDCYVQNYKLDGYLEAREQDGYVRAFTYCEIVDQTRRIEEMESEIESLKSRIADETRDLDYMKEHMIEQGEND